MLGKILLVFLLLMKLELHDIPIIARDLFVVADVDLFSALRDQSHVVTNHNNTPLKFVQAPCKRINGCGTSQPWVGE